MMMEISRMRRYLINTIIEKEKKLYQFSIDHEIICGSLREKPAFIRIYWWEMKIINNSMNFLRRKR